MRLKSIRLAGFKSFVDPATVSLPGNLTAIVGPNGCGKSNIIDAVRWVMGEGSARTLRGESMADVIFGGSNGRKAVGQASVELIFDNEDGSLGGAFSAYAQIAIRRQVSRDGQSQYHLNGSRCRRRDITDLFLGTGLGPRSYAIIEQGMIGRLVEAKPEELRAYIEEAAGISRYKERRRESESRMRRTEENLARLEDLRGELARNLERLQRQAQAAEQYRALMHSAREARAQLAALRFARLQEQCREQEKTIAALGLSLEEETARQRHEEASLLALREKEREQAQAAQRIQARLYALAADIARIEQNIQHHQQRLRQLQKELEEAGRVRQQSEQQSREDRALLDSLDEQLALLDEQHALAAERAAQQGEALEQAEAALRARQETREHSRQAALEPLRRVSALQARIAQLEPSLLRLALLADGIQAGLRLPLQGLLRLAFLLGCTGRAGKRGATSLAEGGADPPGCHPPAMQGAAAAGAPGRASLAATARTACGAAGPATGGIAAGGNGSRLAASTASGRTPETRRTAARGTRLGGGGGRGAGCGHAGRFAG